MGRNRFREDALKYWDIKCEDAWTRFEEAVRCSIRYPAAAVSAALISSNISLMSSIALPRWEQRLLRHLPEPSSRQVGDEAVNTLIV